jgi:hypothetical protein
MLSVLFVCETSFLTLREGRRLRMLGNRAMKKIFRPKKREVTVGWRKLHNEKL